MKCNKLMVKKQKNKTKKNCGNEQKFRSCYSDKITNQDMSVQTA